MSAVLGISASGGPAAAAVVVDRLPRAAEVEATFTRTKDDGAFPTRAIRFCLAQSGLRPSDLDAVVYGEKPLRRFERTLLSHLRAFPRSARTFADDMYDWLGDRMWIHGRIAEELGVDAARVRFCSYHRALACHALAGSGENDAALLVVDGAGEGATVSLGRAADGRVDLLREIRHPHSLVCFATAAARHLGLGGGRAGAARLTALARRGRPRVLESLRELVVGADDGSFQLVGQGPIFWVDPEQAILSALAKRFDPARRPSDPLRASADDMCDADFAASAQVLLEEAVLRLVGALYEEVPTSALCFAGELALDLSLVERVEADGPYRRVYVPPHPGNEGSALGAARMLAGAGDVALRVGSPGTVLDPFLGEALPRCENRGGELFPDDDALLEELCVRLAAGQIVAWVRGRGAFAQQSLGRRNLFLDPGKGALEERLRERIKAREPYRPYTLLVTAEEAPAHDFAAVRVVSRDLDPLLHGLLERYGKRVGRAALLTSSLNAPGDVVVRSEAEALAFFESSELDALFVERTGYFAKATSGFERST